MEVISANESIMESATLGTLNHVHWMQPILDVEGQGQTLHT